MLKALVKARPLLVKARTVLTRQFSKHYYPFFYEDLDYLIKAIDDLKDTLQKGEQLPP